MYESPKPKSLQTQIWCSYRDIDFSLTVYNQGAIDFVASMRAKAPSKISGLQYMSEFSNKAWALLKSHQATDHFLRL